VEPFDYVVKAGKPARKKGVSQGDTLGEKICKSRVDFPPPRSTSKWSRTGHRAPGNFSGPAQYKLLYKGSGPD